jgi:hypothetical protein
MDMSGQLHASVVSTPRERAHGCEARWAPDVICKLWSREKYLALQVIEPQPFSPQSVTIASKQFRLMYTEMAIINYSTNITLSQTGYNQRTHLHSQYRYANIRNTHTFIILGKG